MQLIHNYIYREVVILTLTIIAVLTFLLVGLELFKVVELILYTDLPLWLTLKFIWLLIPFTLTLTIPTGLLAAVLIVFGRMSSDRELLALKSTGLGLAPIVAPVFIIASLLMVIDFWIIASVNPECRKEYNDMKHEIVTNNPLALFTPEVVLDKIPGWRIYFSRKKGAELDDVILWQLNPAGQIMTSIRAERATIDLDLEHQQLVMTLFNEREENYPSDADPLKVQPGARAAQLPVGVSLNSFYEKASRHLAWMTLPEIQEVIFAMQDAPKDNQEEVTPYLTELQARISFSLACFTFVFVGIPSHDHDVLFAETALRTGREVVDAADSGPAVQREDVLPDLIRQYILSLHSWTGIGGVYDFTTGTQRGLVACHIGAERRVDDFHMGLVLRIGFEGGGGFEGGVDGIIGIAVEQAEIATGLQRDDAGDQRGELGIGGVDLCLGFVIDPGRVAIGDQAEMVDHGLNPRK